MNKHPLTEDHEEPEIDPPWYLSSQVNPGIPTGKDGWPELNRGG